jgi:hypothetical protein
LRRFEQGKELRNEDFDFFKSRGVFLLDEKTLDALANLPQGERDAACRKFASTMALTKFTDEINKRADQLYTMAQNPNLPDHAVQKLEEKTSRLLNHSMAVLRISRLREETLNQVRADVIASGEQSRKKQIERQIILTHGQNKPNLDFTDCEDFTICNKE